jgi:hypothetical protein
VIRTSIDPPESAITSPFRPPAVRRAARTGSSSGRRYGGGTWEESGINPLWTSSDPRLTLEQERSRSRPVVVDEPSDGGELFLAPEDRILGHGRRPLRYVACR